MKNLVKYLDVLNYTPVAIFFMKTFVMKTFDMKQIELLKEMSCM